MKEDGLKTLEINLFKYTIDIVSRVLLSKQTHKFIDTFIHNNIIFKYYLNFKNKIVH